jgi:ABC-type polysaccharide/polyol phosphate transport system ATPase subunit
VPLAINAENVGVWYKLHFEKKRTLRRDFISMFQRNGAQKFWALRHLNLQVAPGEVVGVIGTNGAGKSTLLKVLAGILIPDEGRLTTYGRVSTLLQLGAGFEPELSGRENIYLNGLVLGLTGAEIEGRFEEIVDFAQLGRFIDAPLKTYSSGMQARLGFSVACSVDPHILLVDEILAVGDETFREKSYNRMLSFKEQGKTILLVSHNLEKIQSFCPRGIWLNQGSIACDGDTSFVVAEYLRYVQKRW